MENQVLRMSSAVFAVGDNYQIMALVSCACMMWVRVGDEEFFDDANGTLRSATLVHRMTVPRALLDEAKEYTVCWRVIKERKAYFTCTEDVQVRTYAFRPVGDGVKRAYLLADVHNMPEEPIQAALAWEKQHGPLDFLILAGDIPTDSSSLDRFDTIYEIIDQVTHGEIPVVYAKGNHDLRGVCAEKMDDYTPLENGHTYFTFRLGDIWGLCLDCGEDKPDDHPEYGFTVCCHAFRKRQTAYIRSVIQRAEQEYQAQGVKHKLVVVHHPFYEQQKPPFDIEQELFALWCSLLKDHVQPHMMISGHLHRLQVNEPGGPKDYLGLPCRGVVGSRPYKDDDGVRHFVGAGFTFGDAGVQWEFSDEQGRCSMQPDAWDTDIVAT